MSAGIRDLSHAYVRDALARALASGSRAAYVWRSDHGSEGVSGAPDAATAHALAASLPAGWTALGVVDLAPVAAAIEAEAARLRVPRD